MASPSARASSTLAGIRMAALIALLLPAAPAVGIVGGVSVEDLLRSPGSGPAADVGLARDVAAVSVALSISTDAREGLCSGTIVHPLVILTAAHCVVDQRGKVARDVVVHFGTRENSGSTRRMLDLALHPAFGRVRGERLSERSGMGYPDFALLLLHRPIPDTHRPVNLVEPGFRDSRGLRKIIAGYGMTRRGGSGESPSLHFGEMYGNSRADQGGLSGEDEIILESRYAAGQRISACKGDSGGPVFVLDPRGTSLRQFAVTSMGDHLCRDVGISGSIDAQRAILRRMFDTLMEHERGARQNPF
jgi:hypothetical protein